MASELAKQTCKPCSGDATPLEGEPLRELAAQLSEGWNLVNEHHLEKAYSFNDFAEALDFTNRVGRIAEEQNHHPDIYLAYGKVTVQIWSHKIDGLTESDFILAAKCDRA